MGVKERARRMGFLSVGRHGEEARIDVKKVSGRQRGSAALCRVGKEKITPASEMIGKMFRRSRVGCVCVPERYGRMPSV